MTISNILKPISVALAIFLAADYSLAGPLPDYSFKSPAFNGNGYSTHELTKYNLEQTRAKEIQQALESKAAAAKAEAKDIQSEALKKATDVEAKANAYAAKVAADSKAEFEKTQVLLVKMRNECDAEAGKIAKAKEELASIEKKLADVKAKMQALFS